MRLLLRHLDRQQAASYQRSAAFDVRGQQTGSRYRLFHEHSANVVRLEPVPHRTYCLLSRPALPIADLLLVQKLLLETDEARFLRTAR